MTTAPKNCSAPTSHGLTGELAILETDLAKLRVYAARAGARSTDWTLCMATGFLLTRRMVYFKVSPGDCGSPGTAIGNSGLLTGTQYAGLGTAGLSVGLAADKLITGSLTGLAGSLSTAVPIIGSAIGIIAGIAGAISAHHKQAVAQEQATLCAVSGAYNQAAAQIEAALANGQIDAKQANSYLDDISTKLTGALNSIKKECNSACGFLIALRALQLYNEEVVFPRIASSFSATVGSTVNAAVASGLTGVGTQNGGIGLLAILGSAGLGAHALGVF